jgi:hypothetical protein
MKRKLLARVAVFVAAGALGVISVIWGSNGDSEASGGVTAPVWTVPR